MKSWMSCTGDVMLECKYSFTFIEVVKYYVLAYS